MFAVNLSSRGHSDRRLGPEGISNIRTRIDSRLPVSEDDIELMYDEISEQILSDLGSDIGLSTESKLKNEETIRTDKPFDRGEIDPVKDGGSVGPKIENEVEVVDKSDAKSDNEKEKDELTKWIAEYNKYVQEALDVEAKIKDLGDQAGIAKDEIIAAIVNVEDPFFHPATPGLVRSRLLTERSRIAGGDEKLNQLKEQYDLKLGSLASLGEKIEAAREQLNLSCKNLLSECTSVEEVASLRDHINDIEFFDRELQILQRDKVEAKYQEEQEWLGTLCVRRTFEISKAKKPESKPLERPVVSAVVEEMPEEKVTEPVVDKVEATPVAPNTKGMVGFETFNQNKSPIVVPDETSEINDFGSNNVRLPGVTEGEILKEQRIEEIKAGLNNKVISQESTAGQEINATKPATTDPTQGIEEMVDLEGHKMKVDFNNATDGAGVEPNIPKDVAEAETTLPEVPKASENQNTNTGNDQATLEAQVQTPIQPEVPVVAAPEQPKEIVSPEIQVKEKPKGSIGAFLDRFLKRKHDPTSNEAAQLDKMVTEERKEAGTAQQE